MLFYKSWQRFQPSVILKYSLEHLPCKSVAFLEDAWAAPASRSRRAVCPCSPCTDAGVSAGACALHVTLLLSSFLQMFGVHFVLKLSCTRARVFSPGSQPRS